MDTFFSRQDGPLCLFKTIDESINPSELGMTVHLTLDGDEEDIYWSFGGENKNELLSAGEELERLFNQYIVTLAVVHLMETKSGNTPILYRIVLMRDDTIFLTGDESELAEKTDFKTGENLEKIGEYTCLDSDFFQFDSSTEFVSEKISNKVIYIDPPEENIDDRLLISCHKYGVQSVQDLENLEEKFQELLYGEVDENHNLVSITLENKLDGFKDVLNSDGFKNDLNENIIDNLDEYTNILSNVGIFDLKAVFFSFPLFSDLTLKIVYLDGEGQLLVNVKEKYCVYFEETDKEDVFNEYLINEEDLTQLKEYILNRRLETETAYVNDFIKKAGEQY